MTRLRPPPRGRALPADYDPRPALELLAGLEEGGAVTAELSGQLRRAGFSAVADLGIRAGSFRRALARLDVGGKS